MTDAALRIAIRMTCGEEIAFGPGKADLLEAIAREGSISAGARALGMSYRRAWTLVDVMNRCWDEPLVATVPGRAQGGATLTDLGRFVLVRYRAMQEAAQQAVSADASALWSRLLDAPHPADG